MIIAFRKSADKERVSPCMEVKNRLSEGQIAVKGHLEAGGHGYNCSSDHRDVVETLKSWGVLRSISVQ